MLGSCDCNVQATEVIQKTKSFFDDIIVVTAHAVKDYNILLLALEGIDCVNLEADFLSEFLRYSFTFLFKFVNLTCVRSNDSNSLLEGRYILSGELGEVSNQVEGAFYLHHVVLQNFTLRALVFG